MASLNKKMINGNPYYYLRECKRIDGKPKIVWQEYIGSPSQLVARLTNPEPKEIVVRDFGAVVAAYDLVEQLNMVATIDRHVPKRGNQGPTVGQYLVMAAINRCVAPCSKSKMAEWYERTVLARLTGMKTSQLTSQRFWDNMERVDEKAIVAIEEEIAATAVSRFHVDLSCLAFDATNFFTFIDSFNNASHLAQRGHGKEGRDNLRIIGLALLVSCDGQIPLLHHTYAGNQADSVTFSGLVNQLADRCRVLGEGVCDITLVFDKGNNSKQNLKKIAEAPFHFIGSLVPTQHPDLLAIGRGQMYNLDPAQFPTVSCYRTSKKIFGVERTVLVTYNKQLYQAQLKTLLRETSKRKKKLARLQDRLEAHAKGKMHGKQPTLQGTKNKIDAILSARHMKDLFSFTIETVGKDKLPKLIWSFQDSKWKELKQTLLGKTILFTDRADWSDEQVVRGYRSQHHVETAFRRMKDPRFLTFRPTNHWTDQKVRVHAFYCVLALMILSLLRRQLENSGMAISIQRMVERLSDIKEVHVLYPTPKRKLPRLRAILSKCDKQQLRMLKILQLSKYQPT
jgi:transposase